MEVVDNCYEVASHCCASKLLCRTTNLSFLVSKLFTIVVKLHISTNNIVRGMIRGGRKYVFNPPKIRFYAKH
jgi:hypothetical protein